MSDNSVWVLKLREASSFRNKLEDVFRSWAPSAVDFDHHRRENQVILEAVC
jgi:hypothetical protein